MKFDRINLNRPQVDLHDHVSREERLKIDFGANAVTHISRSECINYVNVVFGLVFNNPSRGACAPLSIHQIWRTWSAVRHVLQVQNIIVYTAMFWFAISAPSLNQPILRVKRLHDLSCTSVALFRESKRRTATKHERISAILLFRKNMMFFGMKARLLLEFKFFFFRNCRRAAITDAIMMVCRWP